MKDTSAELCNPRLVARHFIDRAATESVGTFDIAMEPEMDDTAAVRSATEHGIVGTDFVEDIHRRKHDDRRSDDIAAEIEDQIGMLRVALPPRDPLVLLWRHLHAGGEFNHLRHTPEVSPDWIVPARGFFSPDFG